MTYLRSFSLSVMVSAFLFGSASMAQELAPAARIVNPIDESQTVTLSGTVHPLANAANDRGAAPDSMPLERMHLVLKRSDSQESALHQLIADMHTPGSASYHKWLTPDEFGKQFGPSDQDIATAESWLQSHGFAVKQVNPGKQTIEFSGNVAQLRNVFHTQIHRYQVNGETHYSNATDPQIPAALSPVVGGFVALNNFPVKSFVHVLGKASFQPRTHQATPQWTYAYARNFMLAPSDFAVQYDLNSLYQSGVNGSGQSIAIVNESNIDIEQVNQFRSIFGLPANPPQVVIDGNDPGISGSNDENPNPAASEAYLDVEWAGAVAPGATVYLVIAADTDLEAGLYLAAEHAVYSNIAPVISVSFGLCEQYLGPTNSFLASLWEQAAAQGITVMVSAGDSGSAGCDYANCQIASYAVGGLSVNGLASTPYNVAVGGTDFYYPNYQNLTDAELEAYWNLTITQLPQVSLLQVVPEQPWNESQFGLDVNGPASGTSSILSGSGGASSCEAGTGSGSNGGWSTCTGGYAKPSWQSGTGIPADQVRDIPDVSLFAAGGSNLSSYAICASDGDCQPVSGSAIMQITGASGTSASSPAFAGMMALVNQKYGRQGQANFILYPLKQQFPAAFHDVTHGTNSVPCTFSPSSPNCTAVANPLTVNDPINGTAIEGQMGAGTTPAYNAAAGYNLATGLGTIDAAQMVNHWGDVTFAPTTTILASSSNSFTHGTPVAISGSVTASSGTPTGEVALMTDSPTPVQQGLTNFTLTKGFFSSSAVAVLPGGTYNIWGQYSGDSENAPSTSAKTEITVSPESSILSFFVQASGVASQNFPPMTAIPYGMPLWAFAHIGGSSSGCQSWFTGCPNTTIPTGSVVFSDNGATVYSAPVDMTGVGNYTAAYSQGSHSVSASYSGDSSYQPSTASAVNFTVVKDTPAILLTINGSSSAHGITGQSTVLTVQVTNSSNYSSTATPPTGNVTLSGAPSGVPGSAALSPAIVRLTLTLTPVVQSVEGVATIVFPSSVPAGSYPITVTYPGDSNYSASIASMTVTIASADARKPSSITATASATSSTPFAPIEITSTVSGQTGSPTPTGTVNFFSNGSLILSDGLSPEPGTSISGVSFPLTSRFAYQGALLITVQYSGDTNYLPSVTTLNLSIPHSDFSMVPFSANIPFSSGGSANDTIQLASVNGFTGTVHYTCSAATGVTCSLNPASNTLSSNGSAATILTVTAPASTGNGTYNVLITATDSTGQYIHTLGLDAIVGSSNSSTQSFSLTNSGSMTLARQPASQTSTLTVTPSGGFTGRVNFSCFVIGNPTGLTCSAPQANITGTLPATSTLTVSATSATPPGNYVATITAADAATGKISASTAVPVTVTAILPTITFAVPNHTYGDAPFTVAATSNSSGAITYSVVSGPATISGSTVTLTGAGSVVLQASQVASGNYTAGTQTATVTVAKESQTITFTTLMSPVTYGVSPITLVATGGASGNAVAFSVLSGPGTISASTLTITGVGTVVVAANQAGNANYAAATQATQSIVVNQATQTITFTAPTSPVSYGVSPITLVATGGASGNQVTFSIVSGGSYGSLSGTNNNTLTITGVGTIMVAANQAGNANYSAASQVTQSIVVNVIGVAATPTFSPLAGTYTAAQTVTISDATSGATIYYTTNGSTPTTSSTVYSGAITVSSTESLEAIATATGYTISAVATAAYTISIPTNPIPAISGISPAFTNAGGTVFTLTVNGSGFIAGSTVYWGTSALTTTYVSATQLTTQVPAADIAAAGTIAITVQTPTPGGGTSNAWEFEVDSVSSGSTAPTITSTTETVTAGTPASYPVTVPSTVTSVSVTCLNLPTGASCSYSSTTNAVTIATSSTTPKGTYQIIVVFTETVSGAASGFILLPILLLPLGFMRKKLAARGIWLTACLGLVLMATAALSIGCGGGSSGGSSSTPPPATHQVTSSGAVSLTVQ
jgi:subtilase family serine protease